MNKVAHRNTCYRQEWEVLFPWLRQVENDKSKAKCSLCNAEFHINSSGKAQVNVHAKTKRHLELSNNNKTLENFFAGSGRSDVSSISKGKPLAMLFDHLFKTRNNKTRTIRYI